MKRQLLLAAAISTALIGCNQQAAEPAAEAAGLDTPEKRISYGMGIGLGQRLKQETFTIDVDTFAQGVTDAVNGGEQLMTQEEIMAEMQAFSSIIPSTTPSVLLILPYPFGFLLSNVRMPKPFSDTSINFVKSFIFINGTSP